MKNPSKIDVLWGPESLNKFLNHKLIWHAYILAMWTAFHFLQREEKNLKDEMKHITKAKNHLIETKDLVLISVLKRRANRIKKKLDFLQTNRLFLMENARGRPYALKYKIAAVWAFEMRGHNRKPWTNVVRLLEWFYERLKGTAYAESLKTSDRIKNIAKSFKKQCSPIIDNNVENLVCLYRSQFDDRSKLEIRSIIFDKKNIETNAIYENEMENFKIEFRDYGIEPIQTRGDLQTDITIPQMIFPSGEIFLQSS